MPHPHQRAAGDHQVGGMVAQSPKLHSQARRAQMAGAIYRFDIPRERIRIAFNALINNVNYTYPESSTT